MGHALPQRAHFLVNVLTERGDFPAQFRHGSLAVQNQPRQSDRNCDYRYYFRGHGLDSVDGARRPWVREL